MENTLLNTARELAFHLAPETPAITLDCWRLQHISKFLNHAKEILSKIKVRLHSRCSGTFEMFYAEQKDIPKHRGSTFLRNVMKYCQTVRLHIAEEGRPANSGLLYHVASNK